MTAPTPVTSHRLTDDAGAVVEFDGTLLASVTSQNDLSKRYDYSVVEAYRTAEGRFVLRTLRSRYGEGDRVVVKVFASRQLAQAWLGFGALSLRLYAAAGWPL